MAKWNYREEYVAHNACMAHYEKKLTKNIRPTNNLQIYTSI